MTPSQIKMLEDIKSGAWRLVPGEATHDMACVAGEHANIVKADAKRVFAAMLAASPDTTPALVEMIEGLVWDLGKQTARALAAERERDALREALRRIHNCGQSAEPDHWKFRCMARDTAARALKGAQL